MKLLKADSVVLFYFSHLGNKAMQSRLFHDAIELYNCAIALCENSAVYYCNRCKSTST